MLYSQPFTFIITNEWAHKPKAFFHVMPSTMKHSQFVPGKIFQPIVNNTVLFTTSWAMLLTLACLVAKKIRFCEYKTWDHVQPFHFLNSLVKDPIS